MMRLLGAMLVPGLFMLLSAFAPVSALAGSSSTAAVNATASPARVVRLATAEWPPYLGEALPDNGAVAVLLRAAFAQRGYRLELQFFPWARTLQVVRDPASGFDGYAVDYHSDPVARDWLLSQPVFYSPLVMAESSARPLSWQVVTDLQRYRIGLVSGYTNTPEIDRLVADGAIQAEFVGDDISNLRRLAAGRVDGAIVDRDVFDWLNTRDPGLSRLTPPLRAGNRVLDEKALYACFKKSARGAELQKEFDAGLRGIDARKIIGDYMRRVGAVARSR